MRIPILGTYGARAHRIAITAAIGLGCADPTRDREPPLAITGATLIDGTGAAIPDATIVTRQGRIVALGSHLAIPRGARIINASGRWIIPGMIDVHVHLWESARPGAQPTFVADLTRWFPFDQETRWTKQRGPATLSRYLCSGVTSVVALGAVPWERELRSLADSTGRGPRVFIAGGIVGNWPPDSGQP